MSCEEKAIGVTYREPYFSDEEGEAVPAHHKASPLSPGAIPERKEKSWHWEDDSHLLIRQNQSLASSPKAQTVEPFGSEVEWSFVHKTDDNTIGENEVHSR